MWSLYHLYHNTPIFLRKEVVSRCSTEITVSCLCRNVEADVALRSTAAVFTYCRSRGLFAGISLEGSYLIERKDTNRKCVWRPPFTAFKSVIGRGLHVWVFLIRRFYSRDVRASGILNGDVEPPHECSDLYRILEEYTEAYTADWTSKNMVPKVSEAIILLQPCTLANVWLTFCVFGPFSLLVLHPDLQLPLNKEPRPATSHQQPVVTVMPFKCCCFWRCRRCMNVFMCSDGSAGRKNALYPSISIYKSETSSKFSSGLFYLSFN